MENNTTKIDEEKLSQLDLSEFYQEIEIRYLPESKINNIIKFFDISDSNSEDSLTIGYMENLSYYSFWQDDQNFDLLTSKLKSDQYNISYWRRIKGDGNCYYRAVMVQYLEIIITACITEEKVDKLICFIKDLVLFEFDDKEKYKEKVISILCYMVFLIKNKKYSQLGNFVYSAINKSEVFEKTLIYWLRLKLIYFLKSHLTFEINGMKLLNLLPGFEYEDDNSYDQLKIDKYIENELIKMDEFVEGYPLYITPILLKVNIDVYHIQKKIATDMNDNKKVQFDIYIHSFENISDKVSDINEQTNYLSDINKDKRIKLLFRSSHYECLYNNEDKTNYKNVMDIKIFEENQINKDDYNKLKQSHLNKIIQIKNNNKNSLNGMLNKEGHKSQIISSNINNNDRDDLKKLSIKLDISNVNQHKEIIKENYKSSSSVKELERCWYCQETINNSAIPKYTCYHILCIKCTIYNLDEKFKYYNNQPSSFKYLKKKLEFDECKDTNEVINQAIIRKLNYIYPPCCLSYGSITIENLRPLLDIYFQNKQIREDINKKVINEKIKNDLSIENLKPLKNIYLQDQQKTEIKDSNINLINENSKIGSLIKKICFVCSRNYRLINQLKCGHSLCDACYENYINSLLEKPKSCHYVKPITIETAINANEIFDKLNKLSLKAYPSL